MDLALLNEDGGEVKLAAQLENALRGYGLFYVINHGIPFEDMDRQFAIAEGFFALPLEQKLRYHDMAQFMAGNSVGYRPTSTNQDVTGSPDNIQIYMMAQSDMENPPDHPHIIESQLQQIRKFTLVCFVTVLAAPDR